MRCPTHLHKTHFTVKTNDAIAREVQNTNSKQSKNGQSKLSIIIIFIIMT